MQRVFDEGITKVNNRPLPVECLISGGGKARTLQQWERLHYHKYIEMLYVMEGHYEVYLNGKTVDMPAGSLVIINADELHTTRTLAENNKHLCVKFIPQILYSLEQTFTEMEYAIPYIFEHFSDCRCFVWKDIEGTFVPEAISRVCAEHTEKQFGYELVIRAEVMRIFMWIIRQWYIQAGKREVIVDPGIASIVSKAREYVGQHFTDATLSDAAKYCNLSYSYFSRIFKQYMKMSFSNYVNLVRVNYSMQQLALTNMSITEIALSSGFSSTSYYIHTFRQIKHISPAQFRKTFKQPEGL